jgi:hypothetical protein
MYGCALIKKMLVTDHIHSHPVMLYRGLAGDITEHYTVFKSSAQSVAALRLIASRNDGDTVNFKNSS